MFADNQVQAKGRGDMFLVGLLLVLRMLLLRMPTLLLVEVERVVLVVVLVLVEKVASDAHEVDADVE